ncbi:MAG TPA: hypothetical protein DIC34_08045 [Treponema sp.]|nr:MAG: hypothetical protein A2Y36_08120 [Treponema sp. GWA1_62_8]OHE62913.1 MAG: hypothetical protein A2001_00485 [Treponema sp. GWC1_61_84]HCM26476.1 hypothetical protein [Treponema sp.]
MNDIRILHLEDSPRDAELVRELLSGIVSSERIDLASNEQEFVSFLKGGDYNLILADYQLPGFDAHAALRFAKKFRPDLPFIVVSGAIGEEKAVEILIQGATDYVLKDRLCKLPLAIERALDEVRVHEARRQAEAEKNTLLRELYHRTINNMQLISSLLNLYGNETDDKYLKGIFRDMVSRINSMSLVQKELYESKNLTKVDMGAYLTDLLEQISLYYGIAGRRISISARSDEIFLRVETAIPIGLIVNDLVVNSIRHAFEGRTEGSIRVELSATEGGGFRLSVIDDGIGVPADFSIPSCGRMGLTSVTTLARDQLGGVIEYSSGDGFRITIDFKTL